MPPTYDSGKGVRVAFLTHHPTQYEGPMFKYLASEGWVELVVYFMSDMGISRKPDPETGIDGSWDIPILAGYESRFLGSLKSLMSYLKELDVTNLDVVVVEGYTHLLSWLTLVKAKLSGVTLLLKGDTTLLYREQTSIWKRFLKRTLATVLFPGIDGFLPVGTLSAECF